MKTKNTLGDSIIFIYSITLWLIGISVETGWSAFFSIVFPPYAWYCAANFIIYNILLK